MMIARSRTKSIVGSVVFFLFPPRGYGVRRPQRFGADLYDTTRNKTAEDPVSPSAVC